MSMCTCHDCDSYIDSDVDPECFVEVGNMKRLHKTIILCERCREERWEEQERLADMASAAQYRSEAAQ